MSQYAKLFGGSHAVAERDLAAVRESVGDAEARFVAQLDVSLCDDSQTDVTRNGWEFTLRSEREHDGTRQPTKASAANSTSPAAS